MKVNYFRGKLLFLTKTLFKKLKRKPESKLICNCPYPREYKNIDYIRWYFDNGKLTDFMLCKHKPGCGRYYGFPQENFDLVMKKDKEKFLSYLKDVSSHLD